MYSELMTLYKSVAVLMSYQLLSPVQGIFQH